MMFADTETCSDRRKYSIQLMLPEIRLSKLASAVEIYVPFRDSGKHVPWLECLSQTDAEGVQSRAVTDRSACVPAPAGCGSLHFCK